VFDFFDEESRGEETAGRAEEVNVSSKRVGVADVTCPEATAGRCARH
jgi:hypothetical protein